MSAMGLVLAAGAGRRFGGPKALVPGWLDHACEVLASGGCGEILVVIGAEADAVRPLVPESARVVVCDEWAEGMGASLRLGLTEVAESTPHATSAIVHLVDLPDVGADVVRRLLSHGASDETALARAAYNSVPGHPVLIGRAHWQGVVDSARGDAGARAYLRQHPARAVECGDLARGLDVDQPQPTRDQPGAE